MVLIAQGRKWDNGEKCMCFGPDSCQSQASQSETVHCCLNDPDNCSFSLSSQQWSCRAMQVALAEASEETLIREVGIWLGPYPVLVGKFLSSLLMTVSSCLEKVLSWKSPPHLLVQPQATCWAANDSFHMDPGDSFLGLIIHSWTNEWMMHECMKYICWVAIWCLALC